jgi:hypothetical protein
MFMDINEDSEEIIHLKTQFILGRDTKTPTQNLPKSIPVSVPGPSSSIPSASKQWLLFMVFYTFFLSKKFTSGKFTVK